MFLRLIYMFNFLILIGCTRKIETPYIHISDCVFLSKIMETVGLVDEQYCDKLVEIQVDTTNYSYLYNYDMESKPLHIRKWNFTTCEDFKMNIAKTIEYRDLKYKLVDSEMDQGPWYISSDSTCFAIIVSEILEYNKGFLISISIENKSSYPYGGTFLFDVDKKYNIDNIKIFNHYSKNPKSLKNINLLNKFPFLHKKNRY